MLTIAAPSLDSSQWLQDAFASLAPRVAEFNATPSPVPAEELKLLHALNGYLNTYIREAYKRKGEAEQQAAKASREYGIDSPEFRQASQQARAVVDLLVQVSADNRTYRGRIWMLSRATEPGHQP
jgi:hypothetical protein